MRRRKKRKKQIDENQPVVTQHPVCQGGGQGTTNPVADDNRKVSTRIRQKVLF